MPEDLAKFLLSYAKKLAYTRYPTHPQLEDIISAGTARAVRDYKPGQDMALLGRMAFRGMQDYLRHSFSSDHNIPGRTGGDGQPGDSAQVRRSKAYVKHIKNLSVGGRRAPNPNLDLNWAHGRHFPSPEDSASRAMITGVMLAAIEKLRTEKPDYAPAVQMYYFDGLSEAEIAERLGKTQPRITQILKGTNHNNHRIKGALELLEEILRRKGYNPRNLLRDWLKSTNT
ncbi:MAG: sigma-70 family RNA polymerase sigma factor [Candidatus Liptonbacteria bacterium]|nr:sigma-70 family RNA polymerase sigma factor [Candidatus Liptonbacteria bacterium]